MNRRFVLLAVLVVQLALGAIARADPESYAPGDLIYIKIPTSFGRAIEEVTHAPVSHVGVVAQHESGHLTVVHALGTVQEEPIERFLERGKGHFAVARYPFHAPEDRDRFVAAARALIGLPYDYEFSMTNQAMYCSELVYRAFQDGLSLIPVPLHPLTFGAPESESRRVMDRITHGHCPEGTPGISPGDYFAAPAFQLIENQLGQ